MKTQTTFSITGVAAVAAAVLAVVVILTYSPVPSEAIAENPGPEVRLLSASKAAVELEFQPRDAKAGTLEAELCDMSGKVLAKITQVHTGKPVKVSMFAAIDPENLANYYLSYRFDGAGELQRRSLYFMKEILETTVLFHRQVLAGTRPVVRVLVKDRSSGLPVAGAAVKLVLVEKDAQVALHEGQTDARGELSVPLAMPDHPVKGARLTITVTSTTAADKVEETLDVVSSTRTLLVTDKPMYQPGQTIHMRALSLARPDMRPLGEAEATFEVEDAKGNKVFKQGVRTDRFGVSHADFVLGDELNKGSYKVRVIVAGAPEEKTVTVERYVLPKFKVEFKTDRRFYQPADVVRVDLQTDYFFGKPVAGAKVQVKCAKFDLEYADFSTVDAQTDATGHCSFEVKLPEHFVGQPLEAGKASAKFDVTVTDTADHSEKITRNVTVTGAPILIVAVPESGELIAGLENRVYVVTTYADATPAKCTVTWTDAPGGKAIALATDEAGFAQITLTPEEGRDLAMTLTAKDAAGHAGRAALTLKPRQKTGDDTVLLRTDRSIYRVGDDVAFTVHATRKKGTIYVDVIKDRQTFLTKTLELENGRVSGRLVMEPNLAGTLQINAYLIGANGVIVRDRRLVIVDPADDLQIAIANDQESYLPGTEAKITFRVSDRYGRGVASALGVMVVDEAVFALQEMQPGLEKVYFYLEKEIATPQYEIHGIELEQTIFQPMRGAEPLARKDTERRDAAARVLLASAKGAGDYTIHVNTYDRDNRAIEFQRRMQPILQKTYDRIAKALADYGNKHKPDKTKRSQGIDLADLVAEGFLKAEEARDPWGAKMKLVGSWCQSCQTYHGFGLTSPGIDGIEGTADDIDIPAGFLVRTKGDVKFAAERLRRENGAFDAAEPMMALAAVEKEAPGGPQEGGHGGGGAQPPRIREYFPETLLFNPALITDGRGLATLRVPLADSITTWRLTCQASSLAGQLGSTTSGVRVFQEFFVDVDFPVSLTQNDQVHVPVVVYNYLKTDQTVRLEVKDDNWYKLLGPAVQTLKLGPSEVRAVHFPITAQKIGFHKFTVFGYGATKSDAVARSVEIVPDGKEFLVSQSGRLEKDLTCAIDIPEGAIDDASKIFVKIYPGTLSQVVEGLDKMLRMPGGCFEQTSSTTYPNILVMDYMKTTGKITPEIQMKAEGFINNGYQRLLSFEVPGGGFEWFGKAPAHRVLTAYGLMEFYDMSKVHEVDPAVISRTQQFLAKLQEPDGSYKPDKGGIREGAINRFTDDVLRNTAYITWALASTGYQGPELAKGLDYLANHIDDIKDNYTYALTANTFATVDAKGKTTLALLETLFNRRTEKDDEIWWAANSETPTHARGDTADIEITGLAVQAFIRAGRQLNAMSKAVTYLARQKDAYGTWQSTQATIQAMRAMLMAERDATKNTDATVELACNGKTVQTIKVDASNSDLMQLIDLKELTRKGANTVTLGFKGTGGLLYQVVGRYYLPHPKEAVGPRVEPLSIKLDYDRTELDTEDMLGVTATVTWNLPGKAKMIIVDLGLPPGFTLMPDKLNAMVASGEMEKYSVTGRQIIIYLRELTSGKPTSIQYRLLAKYPLKAKTIKSVVYEYYNPTSRAETTPVELTVSKR